MKGDRAAAAAAAAAAAERPDGPTLSSPAQFIQAGFVGIERNGACRSKGASSLLTRRRAFVVVIARSCVILFIKRPREQMRFHEKKRYFPPISRGRSVTEQFRTMSPRYERHSSNTSASASVFINLSICWRRSTRVIGLRCLLKH